MGRPYIKGFPKHLQTCADIIAWASQEITHIGLGPFDGCGEVVAFSQMCGDGAGKGVACSVAVVEFKFLLRMRSERSVHSVIEIIHQVFALFHTLHQHAATPFGQLLQVVFGVSYRMSQQELRLADIRCDERCEGEELVLVGSNRSVADKLLACKVHDDRVDEDGLTVEASQHAGNSTDNLLGRQDARLDTIGTNGTQERLCLRDNQVHRQVMNALDAVHVFVNNTRQRSRCPAFAASNRLDVCLNTRTAQWFAPRNEENLACIYLFLHNRAQSYDLYAEKSNKKLYICTRKIKIHAIEYMKNLISILLISLFAMVANAQPLVKETPFRGNHHSQRLPGVNERRLARLEKMREANQALRHRQGPWRAQTVPATKRGLVLLVEFSDEESRLRPDAATQWYNRFNQQGFSQNSHVGSVRDYFIEQSYGMLTIDFDVVGPLTLSKTREYYGSAPNGSLDDRAAEMVIDALKLANAQVNYADYDWDGNGWVEQVYVIFAGITEYGTQGYIWPHEFDLNSAKYYGCGAGYQRMDGVYINTYAVSNELASATTLEGIGTACHEFSHCLGYPDFYDTSYSGGTAAQYWDVLDAGSYNGPRNIGEQPSPYTAYERWIAGWIDLIPLTEPTQVKNMPAINEEGVAYIIKNSGNSNEYYILENRQQVTFGRGNGGHGLMVWHIDYNRSVWNSNEVNTDVNHQRMTFLPADGKVGDLVENGGYSRYQITSADEAGDPYPGLQGVESVQPLTWYVAEKSGSKVHNSLIHSISETANGKINFTYGDYMALPTPVPDYPTVFSMNSFAANWMPVEGATSYTLQIEAMTGTPSPSTVMSEDFSGFKDIDNGAQISSSVIDKYTQTAGWTVSGIYGTHDESLFLGSAGIIGSVTTPSLDNRAGKMIIEFDAAYNATDGSSLVVTVLKGDETIATQTVPLTDSRETYSLTLDEIPTGCKVQFSTTGRRRRVYLYNIDIKDMSGSNIITSTITDLTTTSYVVENLESDMYYYRIQAVCEDGSSEWSEWMNVDIASAIRGIKADDVPADAIFDLSGRRLQQIPKQGLYIRNGKTFVVKR